MTDFLIHEAVTRHAAARPDHPALAFRGERMSYSELDAASNRLAQTLLAGGLRRQQPVGVFLHKGLELGVTLYGILKAGGAFVPLDPFLPVDRLRFVLDDCGIEQLVSSEALVPTLAALGERPGLRVLGPAAAGDLACVPWSAVQAAPAEDPALAIADLDLAYLMYTSGSTGVPKGMLHTHRGSLSYARWGADHVGLVPGDVVASHAPLHFDLSIFDFFSTSQAGGTVSLVPEPVTKFPASWTQLLEDEGITVVFTVPFTLIEMLERGALDKRALPALRWVLFGGEPFPPKHLRRLMEVLPDVRFSNVYGPAEAPSCTVYDLPGPPLDDEPVPIGTVSRNSEGLILGEDDEPAPAGEAGELCIRSSTLTLGYWNRPDLTAHAFFERPGLGRRPEVFYRTGDVVRLGEDGLLRFLGRRDRMVKTRGQRVELDEVEAALASHAGVEEAAAYTVPDGAGSRAIHAAVTRSGDATELDAAEVLRHARTKLPTYALPREVDVVDDLPRTSGGKIDRRALEAAATPDPR